MFIFVTNHDFALCASAPMWLKEKSPPGHREHGGDDQSLRQDLQDQAMVIAE
jgi:hypothetical protein